MIATEINRCKRNSQSVFETLVGWTKLIVVDLDVGRSTPAVINRGVRWMWDRISYRMRRDLSVTRYKVLQVWRELNLRWL